MGDFNAGAPSQGAPLHAAGSVKSAGTLGRFELRRKLGQGAQSVVWLAYDPRMQREVAIKLMRSEGSDEQAVAQWLAEARSVGRLKHPSIVPVFEADIQDRSPYLVFEYVEGNTVADAMARRGALPAREAVAILMDVLDALAVAHLEGVVHRDIKPSNILMDGTGRARVMDFGIAARVVAEGQTATNPLSGTIGYLAPEAIRGAVPAPSMDLYACGVVLAELLSGRPLLNERDPHRAMYRTVNEQLQLPGGLGPDVDDKLRSIVNRALQQEPGKRFADARTFFLELDAWSRPPEGLNASSANGAAGGGSSATLDFLLRRMRHKSDFPAMSEAVVRIQSMASSETESVSSVTNEILKDVALTNKLLRIVNTAHYARGGSISTVSRAVTLVGFNGIRNMALSLVLLEHMQDKAHAAQLKEEFLRSLMAGAIGAELCPGGKDTEEAFIGSMFQNLGRLLVQFYFPEEASQIRRLIQDAREPVSEAVASVRVLGLSYEELGVGIAKAWGLPANLQRCIRKPTGTPPTHAPGDPAERIRWVALASNEIADVLLHAEPQEATGRMDQLARKYCQAMGRSAKEVQSATDSARQKLVDMAAAMDIRVSPGSKAAKLLHQAQDAAKPASTDANLGNVELHATQTSLDASKQALVKSSAVTETLAAGIQDITNAMVEDFKLSDVLRMILETMYRALEFDRIIFCMRDPRTDTMTGRFGLGEGVETLAKVFRTHLKATTPDLFSVVCIKGADTMISDVTDPRILQRLPDWYLKSLNAPSFLLLPLQIKSAPFGLIYADKLQKGALTLDEKELALLRTLRNQAVMAFKQSS